MALLLAGVMELSVSMWEAQRRKAAGAAQDAVAQRRAQQQSAQQREPQQLPSVRSLCS